MYENFSGKERKKKNQDNYLQKNEIFDDLKQLGFENSKYWGKKFIDIFS